MVQKDTQKQVVLVTGASAGIGAAISQRFARGGYRIVAVARRQERLEELARQLSALTSVETLAADVTAKDTAERAVDLAIKAFGRLDCLINNAGSSKWAPVHETDDATLDEVIETSQKAPFRFCRAALRVMKPGASIINIGSTFGIHGGLNGGAYCMVKAGLIGLTQTLAAQYGEGGIRANLIAPTVVKTDMTKDYWDYPLFQRINQEMTPSPRDCTTEDVANYAFFVASDQAGYINGQTLALDGGWSTTKYLVQKALLAERIDAKPAS
jgi:3-oxoacyl-[acyl-carrier protein] reductase